MYQIASKVEVTMKNFDTRFILRRYLRVEGELSVALDQIRLGTKLSRSTYCEQIARYIYNISLQWAGCTLLN